MAIIDGKSTSATHSLMLRPGTLILPLIALSGCADSCVNTIIDRVDAPNGLHSAVLFQRDCGATTGFSTQVSVLDFGEEFSGAGNTFRADDDHGRAEVGVWGGPWAEVKWIATDRLLIRYAAKSRFFEQRGVVRGVKVSYQQRPIE